MARRIEYLSYDNFTHCDAAESADVEYYEIALQDVLEKLETGGVYVSHWREDWTSGAREWNITAHFTPEQWQQFLAWRSPYIAIAPKSKASKALGEFIRKIGEEK